MQSVYVQRQPEKGNCLFTRNARNFGEVIYTELPLMFASSKLKIFKIVKQVVSNHQALQSLRANWGFAAIYSVVEDKVNKIDNKWYPNDETLQGVDVFVSKMKEYTDVLPVEYIEALYRENIEELIRIHFLVWRYNSFSHYSDSESLIMYNITSFMAHSCKPSCAWSFGEDDSFVLRSIRILQPNEELTILYFIEDQLIMPTFLRRVTLSGWKFECRCEGRCSNFYDLQRCMRCFFCKVGEIWFNSDTKNSLIDSTVCTICNGKMDSPNLAKYNDLEMQYIDRVQNISSSDLEDIENVYTEALKLFHKKHWVIYKLQDLLLYHHINKSSFLRDKVEYWEYINIPSYTQAWAYQELANLTNHRFYYEQSYWILKTIAGEESYYTTSVLDKWNENLHRIRIEKLKGSCCFPVRPP
jgi:SET domain